MDYDGRPEGFKKIMTEAGEPTSRKEKYESGQEERYNSENSGCLTILIAFIFIIIGLIVAVITGAQYISVN